MKTVLVSQRVDVLPARDERRDAVDQRLLDWVASCDCLPVPVPNRIERLPTLLASLRPAAIVLSGGNDLSKYGGDAPERDAVERALITHATEQQLPLFALCRGAQLLLDVFGSQLQRVTGHVNSRHPLVVGGVSCVVNSYHTWACRDLMPPLRALARSADGTVEAFCHPELPLLGVMWHPEREQPHSAVDLNLFRRLLNREQLQ